MSDDFDARVLHVTRAGFLRWQSDHGGKAVPILILPITDRKLDFVGLDQEGVASVAIGIAQQPGVQVIETIRRPDRLFLRLRVFVPVFPDHVHVDCFRCHQIAIT